MTQSSSHSASGREAIGPSRSLEAHDEPLSLPNLEEGVQEASQVQSERNPHKIMTWEEYAARPLKGWHEVNRLDDGETHVRYLASPAPTGWRSIESGKDE